MNIQNEVQKIHANYGVTEMANYEIQKVCESYARIQIERLKGEITARVLLIKSEPNGIIRESMINNLLIDL